MSFENTITFSQKYFPNLRIKYKNKSKLMKFLGSILFFNKSFMNSYTTVIGNTVYFPNENFVRLLPLSSKVILLHELVHLYDSKKFSRLLFSFLYLFPQILAPFMLLLLLINWKIMLIAFILFLFPIPAFFRMYFEKRAYMASLYVIYVMKNKMNYDPGLDKQKDYFIEQFSSSHYYFMWPFTNIKKDFDKAVEKIKRNQRPFESPIFDVLDDIIKS